VCGVCVHCSEYLCAGFVCIVVNICVRGLCALRMLLVAGIWTKTTTLSMKAVAGTPTTSCVPVAVASGKGCTPSTPRLVQ
jgi:hypothetical protein